jgi:hypothetical protein
MVVDACHPSHAGSKNRGIMVQAFPGINMTPNEKNT